MAFYRVQTAERDVADLLTLEGQTSTSYNNDEDVRIGVSVCDSLEDLAAYLAQTGIPFDETWVVVELDGYFADDEDEDAHLGARLVLPHTILSVTPTTEQLLGLIDVACDAVI